MVSGSRWNEGLTKHFPPVFHAMAQILFFLITLGEFSSITLWAVCAVWVRPQLHKASVHDHLWKTALSHTLCSSLTATSCSFRIACKIVKATLIRVYRRQCPAAHSSRVWCFIMMCLPVWRSHGTRQRARRAASSPQLAMGAVTVWPTPPSPFWMCMK